MISADSFQVWAWKATSRSACSLKVEMLRTVGGAPPVGGRTVPAKSSIARANARYGCRTQWTRASDSSFRGATFNHTWFPITSGRHAGRACAECHTDANNYKVFNCLRCHSLSSVQGEHQGNSGFRYESAACYSCHPTGRG